MTDNNRLRYIDIAKGIAIICIILGHLGNQNINRVVFTFHVPIFFLITGFFINQKRNLQEFVKNKYVTLIVPYILTCLIIIALNTIKGVIHDNAIANFERWTFAALYASGNSYTTPFYIPGIGAIWFLWASFWGGAILKNSFGI